MIDQILKSTLFEFIFLCQKQTQCEESLLKSQKTISEMFLFNIKCKSVYVPPQKMEASFQATAMMEMHVEGGMMTQHLAHKTPPRVPPKPTSRSPPSLVSKVTGGRQQSPSPVRHVKGPTPTAVRYDCGVTHTRCDRVRVRVRNRSGLQTVFVLSADPCLHRPDCRCPPSDPSSRP